MTSLTYKLSVLVAVGCMLVFMAISLRWPLVGDASLMHYVVFLIGRGMIPYRDIVDVNLPGTYGVEWLVVHVLGRGSLAWRFYDIGLGFGALLAMCIIARPISALAGVFAGALFFLLHGRDGVAELGQRDLLMTVLLLWAVAISLSAMRRKNAGLLAVASALAGCAVTVKPSAAIFWIALIVVLAGRDEIVRHGRPSVLVASCAPFFIAPGIALLILLSCHALHPFWTVLTTLIPYHNSLSRLPLSYFVAHIIPSSLTALFIVWVVTPLLRYVGAVEVLSLEEMVLLVCTICGGASFILQGKGYSYHRYPMTAFLVLLMSTTSFTVLRRPVSRSVQTAGLISVCLGGLVLAPQCLWGSRQLGASSQDFSHELQQDLQSLGGSALDGQVQCVDFTSGCITTLSNMELKQSTGFLYDCYALGPDSNSIVRQYRRSFEDAVISAEPAVIVISNQYCGHPDSFGKLDHLSALQRLLDDHYSLSKEESPAGDLLWARQRVRSSAYRIYLRHPEKIETVEE